MKPTAGLARRWVPVALAVLHWSLPVAAAPSIPLTYCASVNTGSTSSSACFFPGPPGCCHR